MPLILLYQYNFVMPSALWNNGQYLSTDCPITKAQSRGRNLVYKTLFSLQYTTPMTSLLMHGDPTLFHQ